MKKVKAINICMGGGSSYHKGSVLQELSCELHKAGRAWSYRRNRNGNMKKIIQLGNFLDVNGSNYPYQGRLYSVHGVSPTLCTCAGGNLITKIVLCK